MSPKIFFIFFSKIFFYFFYEGEGTLTSATPAARRWEIKKILKP